MTPDNPIADTAAGTRLERWFNDHPKTTTAGMVAFALLLLVLGGLLDGVPQ
jgi:hypothetical protein